MKDPDLGDVHFTTRLLNDTTNVSPRICDKEMYFSIIIREGDSIVQKSGERKANPIQPPVTYKRTVRKKMKPYSVRQIGQLTSLGEQACLAISP